jgi:hypothetical protein
MYVHSGEVVVVACTSVQGIISVAKSKVSVAIGSSVVVDALLVTGVPNYYAT